MAEIKYEIAGVKNMDNNIAERYETLKGMVKERRSQFDS